MTINVVPSNSGCSTTGATGAITLSNVPSRFTGVAPLSVFFDASGTTATATATPFHDLDYRWDFGDPAGSPVNGTSWKYGARAGISSRNSETGPLAVHVYETPGVYTVALTATDGTNTVSNSCTQIVVQNPDTVFSGTNTVCVSTGTDFTGCPSGATTRTTSSFNTAMGYIGASTHRLLFKAGDTWTGATSSTISTAGPGIVGSFGSGAKPHIMAGSLGGYFIVLSANDWRITGLDFDGNSANPTRAAVQYAGYDNDLMLNLVTRNLGAMAAGFGGSYNVIQDVVESGINSGINDTAAQIYWTPSTSSAIIGNYIDPQGHGQHVIRQGAAKKCLIVHNTLGNPGATKEVIKLHQTSSPQTTWDGTYTEKVIIADNHLLPITEAWQIVVQAQNNSYPEHLRDIIVENNWLEAGSANAQIIMSTSNVDGLHPSTVKNNILDMSTSNSGDRGITVQAYGPTTVPNNVRVYNNTCYSSASAGFACVQINTATNTLVYNNLASAPSSTSRSVLIDGGTGTLQASNLLNNTPSALFVSGTPAVPADYALKAGANPAVDTGTKVPVLSDFVPNARANGSAWDIGAYER